jgi:hypothetical protein
MITIFNYFIHTKGSFKACKRPLRKPNYISYSRGYYDYNQYEYVEYSKPIISSEYWYGEDKKGKYVIRSSNRWSNRNNETECKKISTCVWDLYIPRYKSKNKESYAITSGKIYLSDLKPR